jgi:receptor protein-tyrosine kinase
MLLGLALGVGAALLRENLTTKVETSEDLARIAGVPSFGEIPAESAVARLRNPEALATEPRLRIVSEALRDLRTNLLFSDGNLRSLVITSPDGSHGKTTISVGLAMTVARAGTKTLLVDGDLRRGRIAQLLSIPPSPGLMEVLLGENDLDEAIHTTSIETLDVLTGGRRGEDPTELLTTSFPSVLSQLEGEYETIVIDSTPVVPISDARVMARFADAVVLVASAGSVTRRQVRAAVERLSLISIRPTAVVLNNSKTLSRSNYYIVPEQDQPAAPAPPKARRPVRP